jgi:hypothetical protein
MTCTATNRLTEGPGSCWLGREDVTVSSGVVLIEPSRRDGVGLHPIITGHLVLLNDGSDGMREPTA